MFSWKKQNPPSQRRSTPSATGDYNDLIAHARGLATADLDHVEGDDDMAVEDGDLGDVDLDDPELLAELQGLTDGISAAKPKAKPAVANLAPSKEPAPKSTASSRPTLAPVAKPAVKNSPSSAQPSSNKPSPSTTPAVLPSLTSLGINMEELMDDGDDEEVELTEDDWNDPHLLAQLEAFGGHVDQHDQKPQHTTGTSSGKQVDPTPVPTDKDVPTSSPVTHSTSIPKETSSLSSPTKTRPPNEQNPLSGTSSPTASHLPKTKVSDVQDADGDSIMAEEPTDSEGLQKTTTVSSAVGIDPLKNPEEPSNKVVQVSLKLLQIRETQYKTATLDAKRAGNMTLAGDRLKTLKALRNYIRLVEAGGFLDPELYQVPDEPPLTTSASAKADISA
ncbi:hypothetical protein BGZ65_005022, partial [Modicella reniformis]